jgi:zeaxanthin glucosyltransferase
MTALFIIMPFPSHYNACLGLMQAKQREGYRVVATTVPTLYNHLTELGIEAVGMPFMEETVIQNGRVWLALWLQSRLNEQFARQRYREFLFMIRVAETIVEQLNPDEIYIDATISHYYFVLSRYQSRIMLLNTRLSTRLMTGVPPYTVARVAQDNWLSKATATIEWGLTRLKAEGRRQLQRTAFGKLHDDVLLSRITQKRGRKTPIQWHRANVGYAIPANVPEWILCPKALEYPWAKAAPNERYVWYPAEPADKPLPGPLANWLANVTANDRVVYCSLGTLSNQTGAIAVSFLTRVLQAVSGMPDVKLIVAAGNLLGALPGNVSESIFLTDWVPQTALLPYCDAMITHGGMSTVKECICAGVPMLTYPLNRKVDQPGNAARIVYHGVGLSGSITHETEVSLRQKLLNVLENPCFKQQMQAMQKCFMAEATLFFPMDLAESR